jgi:hypothetical protein
METEVRLEEMDGRYANIQYWEDGVMKMKFTNWWKQRVVDVQEKDGKVLFVIKRQIFSLPVKHRHQLNEYFQRTGYKIRDYPPLENGKTIQDFLDELGVISYSVGYGDTRTIERAHFRECSAYVISLFGGVVIFRVKNGFLAYKLIFHFGTNLKHIGLDDALDYIGRAEKEKLGKTYWKADEKQAIMRAIENEKRT